VLLVNGESTLYKEKACRCPAGSGLEPNTETTIFGFQTSAKEALPFEVVSPEDARADSVRYASTPAPSASSRSSAPPRPPHQDQTSPIRKTTPDRRLARGSAASTGDRPQTPRLQAQLREIGRTLRTAAVSYQGDVAELSETPASYFQPTTELPVSDISLRYFKRRMMDSGNDCSPSIPPYRRVSFRIAIPRPPTAAPSPTWADRTDLQARRRGDAMETVEKVWLSSRSDRPTRSVPATREVYSDLANMRRPAGLRAGSRTRSKDAFTHLFVAIRINRSRMVSGGVGPFVLRPNSLPDEHRLLVSGGRYRELGQYALAQQALKPRSRRSGRSAASSEICAMEWMPAGSNG